MAAGTIQLMASTLRIIFTSGRERTVTYEKRHQHQGNVVFERYGRVVLTVPQTSIETMEPVD